MVEGIRILLGLDIDVPAGRISVAGPAGEALRGHRVEGLLIGGDPASVEVSGDGELQWEGVRLDLLGQERSSAGR